MVSRSLSAHTQEFYENSILNVGWTAQHACGSGIGVSGNLANPNIDQCQFILQIGCEDAFGNLQPTSMAQYWSYNLTDGAPAVPASVGSSTCVDGRPTMFDDCGVKKTGNATFCDTLNLSDATQRATFTSSACRCSPRRAQTYGYHEPEISYHKCSVRNRNSGLFTADQQLSGTSALYTRQNPNGGANNRHGFECPEERDYYPYWKPTGWRDIAVKTSDTSLCSYYQANSENVLGRCECINPRNASDPTFWVYETADKCNAQVGAQWQCYNPLNMPAPACVQQEWLMDNHLGVSASSSLTTDMPGYQMTMPQIVPEGMTELKCVMRLRYNVSTSNVGFFFNSANNGAVKNNPVSFYGNKTDVNVTNAMPLRLAVNTQQLGRVFEDRSQVFKIKKATPDMAGKTVYNLNVRGKRGNIAQVRNTVEYDFVPKVLQVNQGDMIHIQWCGSDYNDQNNAGQGKAGTDRHNMVPTSTFDSTGLLPLVNNVAVSDPNSTTASNVALAPSIFDQYTFQRLAYQDQNSSQCFSVQEMITTQAQNQNDPRSCHFLNQASPYFSHLATTQNPGVMYYMCTRNNAITNRSQKGAIIVNASGLSMGAIAGISVGVVAGIGAAGAAGLMVYRRKHGSLDGMKYHIMGRVRHFGPPAAVRPFVVGFGGAATSEVTLLLRAMDTKYEPSSLQDDRRQHALAVDYGAGEGLDVKDDELSTSDGGSPFDSGHPQLVQRQPLQQVPPMLPPAPEILSLVASIGTGQIRTDSLNAPQNQVKRKRQRANTRQLEVLECFYESRTTNPTNQQRKELAVVCGMRERSVQIWPMSTFTNAFPSPVSSLSPPAPLLPISANNTRPLTPHSANPLHATLPNPNASTYFPVPQPSAAAVTHIPYFDNMPMPQPQSVAQPAPYPDVGLIPIPLHTLTVGAWRRTLNPHNPDLDAFIDPLARAITIQIVSSNLAFR
ncbi:hypothetical protein HK101_001523, partial [Irineochytrium annulatum]